MSMRAKVTAKGNNGVVAPCARACTLSSFAGVPFYYFYYFYFRVVRGFTPAEGMTT